MFVKHFLRPVKLIKLTETFSFSKSPGGLIDDRTRLEMTSESHLAAAKRHAVLVKMGLAI